MDLQKNKKKQNKFLLVYSVCLVLCFSPFKSLSLLTPLLVVFLLLFYVTVKQTYNFIKLFFFVLLYLLIGFFYFIVNEDFLWTNFFFFLFTFSSYLLLLVSFDSIINRDILNRMTNITVKILFFEAIFGIIQVLYNVVFVTHGFDGGTGDAATGTINPTFTPGDGSASNVYYAISLSALSVLVIVFKLFEKRKLNMYVILTLIFGWLIASVMHSIFLLLASIVINALIVVIFMPKNRLSFLSKQLKIIRATIGITIFIIISLFFFMPKNVDLLNTYYQQTFISNKSRSTKAIATVVTYTELSKNKPYQYYIGLGPGQYCSKASLILSDTYLNSNIPRFLKSVSPDLEKYILPIWLEYKERKWKAGSTYFPFYSWLTVYGELGILGCIVILVSLFSFCRRLLKNVNQENFILVLGIFIVVIYIFLLGIQDNYWEWAQFILPILILVKALYYLAIRRRDVDDLMPNNT